MKLGIFGGTFDPIHLGHLRAAETAREAVGLDQVAFVPAARSPYKGEPVSPALDRYAMVALATAGHDAFVAADLELQREAPSYTVDTVRALRQARPQDTLFLIVGGDSVAELSGWRDSARIFAECTVLAVARPGGPPPTQAAGEVTWVEGPALPVSATDVRSRVREGQSIRFLVPDAVADYIAKRGLYR
ncbi:MAG TPA: nicotinate-nucleotide adenylyltransferase [Vicinamibacteria bacterium]|nr:nicotinate-nucleotide adenylyltransferase [Vicinamibacteria bacterium]